MGKKYLKNFCQMISLSQLILEYQKKKQKQQHFEDKLTPKSFVDKEKQGEKYGLRKQSHFISLKTS